MNDQTDVRTSRGPAQVLAEAGVDQESPKGRLRSAVELLEDAGGLLVRFAYVSNDTVRRGPVTLRALDLASLRAEAGCSIELGRLLGWAEFAAD